SALQDRRDRDRRRTAARRKQGDIMRACRAILLISALIAFPAAAQIEGTNWFPIGPAPIDGFFAGGASGRATAIGVNPANANDVWLGIATGGVWHSLDAGLNWEPESDREDALSIGAIALDECNASGCGAIYAGTGENAIRRDTFYGAGLLIGGTTGGEFPQFLWTQRTGDPVANFRFGSLNDVVLDPTTSGGSKRIFVTFSSGTTVAAPESTITAPEPAGGYGIYRSNDRGATWAKLTVAGSASAKPTDLKMRPDDHNVLFAGFLGRGVFRSTDNGASWCPLNQGIAPPGGCSAQQLPDIGVLAFDDGEIAIALGNPQVVYASFGRCNDRLIQNCVPQLWRSTNGENAWTKLTDGSPNNNGGTPAGYSRYTHALTVDPTDPKILLVGAIRLWRSTNADVVNPTFTAVDTNLAPGSGTARIHDDHHDIVFTSVAGRVYSTGDGGFAVSTDSGVTWTPRNDDLQITGFQSIGASPQPLINKVIGASQDNSGQLWNGGSRRWKHLPCCGDGGYSFIDWDDPNGQIMYVASNFGDLTRSTNAGMSFGGINSALWSSDPRLFYAPFV